MDFASRGTLTSPQLGNVFKQGRKVVAGMCLPHTGSCFFTSSSSLLSYRTECQLWEHLCLVCLTGWRRRSVFLRATQTIPTEARVERKHLGSPRADKYSMTFLQERARGNNTGH